MKRSGARTVLLAGLLTTALGGIASAKPAMMIAGNDHALWLLRRADNGKSYDLVAKPADGEWSWIVRGAGGRPMSLAAAGEQLHLLFDERRGYLIYDLEDRQATPRLNPGGPLWPADADPVALCDAAGVFDESLPGVVAVVPRPPYVPAGASRPVGEPDFPAGSAAAGSGQPVLLGVFLQAGDTWSHKTDCPLRVHLGSESRLLAMAVDERLFVMVTGPRKEQNHLLAFSKGKWQELPLTEWPAGSYAIALLSLHGRLVIVMTSMSKNASARTKSGRGTLQLAIHDEQKQTFSFQPVTLGGHAVTWIEDDLPLAARLADRIAVLFREDGRWKFATCDLTGQLLAAGDVDIFGRESTDNRGYKVLQFFTWGLLLAILLPMFFLRSRTLPGPFHFSATMQPGNLLKRALAGVIDFVPCMAISAGAYRIEPMTFEQMQEMAEKQLLPVEFAYAIVTMLLLYTTYGIVMEMRFGATVGKMILKLRVVGDAGTKPGLREVLLRNLVRTVELVWPTGLPLLLLLPLFTRYRQRLGDLMARTAVIDTTYVAPTPEGPAEEPPMPDDP